MHRIAALASLILASSLALAACDSDGDGVDGPLTTCDFSFVSQNASGLDIGERCTANSECEYGTCLMPGANANITNTEFGFCTRGCDCEDNAASQLSSDEAQTFDCIYPSGFKDRHHVVLLCSSVSDCTAIDSGYTACRAPTTGGVVKVCHAE